ncbi:MAG: hypothetical protein ACI8P9_001374 [Parasphingorhabdus sp.]|jgi:hypothetical protein
MTSRLIQKKFLKGSQEFTIEGDAVNIRIKTRFNEEKLSVMLSVLNPEPIINKSRLEFVSRVNGEALISLYLAKPNVAEFNAFVSELKQRALADYNAFIGLKPSMNDQPLDFTESDEAGRTRIKQKVDVARIANTIRMLQQHLDSKDVGALVSAFEALQLDPQSQSCMEQVVVEFNSLGPMQGAVLTYAPYVSILLSDDPFG